MNIEKLQTAINEINEVTGTRIWDRVEGKERLYIETIKHNGGRNWNGGLGYSRFYVDLNTGAVTMEGEAGAATRKWHYENETLAINEAR